LLKTNLQAKHILSGTKTARCDGYHISSVGRSFPLHEPVPGQSRNLQQIINALGKAGADGKAEVIISRVIEQAANGDTACIRLCFDRFAPSRKDRPVYFALPKMQEAKDAVNASAAIVAAVASGDLTPMEAASLASQVRPTTAIAQGQNECFYGSCNPKRHGVGFCAGRTPNTKVFAPNGTHRHAKHHSQSTTR
jgi:hypothetical protein